MNDETAFDVNLEYYDSKELIDQIFPRLGFYYNALNIQKFVHIFDHTVTCYKYYWMESIINLLSENPEKTFLTFDEIIEEMLANAWYSIREYHLHMGTQFKKVARQNALEKAVNNVADITGLPSDATKKEIKLTFKKVQQNTIFQRDKSILMQEVPFHLLAPFYDQSKFSKPLRELHMKDSIKAFNEINETMLLPYSFGEELSNPFIIIDESWKALFLDNYVPLKGWIQFQKIKYLQDRNPEVPGIIYKLDPMKTNTRRLSKVRVLWDCFMDLRPVRDIYSNVLLNKSDYDVDHFIPWSFLTCDELWDLIPIDSSINSQKSNGLPFWKLYFERFSQSQYELYQLIYDNAKMGECFADCRRDNLKTYWGGEELYCPGRTEIEFKAILEAHLKQHYNAAYRQGYAIWSYQPKGVTMSCKE